MIAILLCAGAALFFAVRSAAERTIDTDLRARLAAVEENLPANLSEADRDELGEALEEQSGTGAAGVWLQVADNRGQWLHRSDAIKEPDQPPPAIEPPRRRPNRNGDGSRPTVSNTDRSIERRNRSTRNAGRPIQPPVGKLEMDADLHVPVAPRADGRGRILD
jgi:hypothetical protein